MQENLRHLICPISTTSFISEIVLSQDESNTSGWGVVDNYKDDASSDEDDTMTASSDDEFFFLLILCLSF
jgi:hypothetical protein